MGIMYAQGKVQTLTLHTKRLLSRNSRSTIHFLLCTDKNPLKDSYLFLSSCSFYIAHIHQIIRDPDFTFYSLCITSHRFQGVLLKKWESIIGTQALYIISIFSWGITPHRPDNLALQIPSLSVLWSHSRWSPGWADSAWKAALFNEQKRAWVERDNRWSVRLMLCSWEWTTFLASCRPGW